MIHSGDTRESELQNLLTDERDRCNQYKQIYQTLKEKHAKLQDELTLIYDQLKEATALNERLRSSSDANVRKLEAKVKEQQIEINALNGRLKSYDEKRIQAEVFEEATAHYETKIKELHAESDKIRDQYNNLHYENAILKCKFESREAEYSRALERVNLQHQGEVELLQSKIEALEKEKTSPTDTYALELKSSKREVLQLNSKVKALLSECEELRTQNENLSVQISSISRTNSKQMSDHLTNIRVLESEKLKANMQKEVLEKELVNAQKHRKALNNELQASRMEALSLRNKCEECEHKYHQMTTNLQMEIEQWKSTKESQQEQFIDEISRLKSELHMLNSNLSQERQDLVIKEQELQQKISIERQQFWKQSRELNQEKEKLLHKIKELEKERDFMVSNRTQELQDITHKLQKLLAEKAELEKDILALREKLGKEDSSNQIIDQQPSKQNLNFEKAIQDLKEKIDLLSASSSTENRCRDSNPKPSDHEIIHLKLSWEQQKLQYQQRLEELESQLREFKTSSIAEKRELEFKMKQYLKKVNGLKEKIELQKLQNEELELQKEALEKNIPPHVHLQVQKQLAELQRRMEEYRLVIATDPNAPTKTTLPSVIFPDKMLSDIKNISFQSLLPQATKSQSDFHPAAADKLKEDSRKTYQPRRKSIKAKDRKPLLKSISPVISSSSDLENL